MSQYQHKKGVIQDNAIQALLHDPLFRQRIEKKLKGKGSYNRKDKKAIVADGFFNSKILLKDAGFAVLSAGRGSRSATLLLR